MREALVLGNQLTRSLGDRHMCWRFCCVFAVTSCAVTASRSDAAAPTNTTPRLVVQSIISGGVKGFAKSQDGKLIATGSEGGCAIVWDGVSGKKLWQLQPANGEVLLAGEVASLTFSPSGRRLAVLLTATFELFTNAAARELRIWDIGSGKEVFRLPSTQKITAVSFSRDEKFLFIGGMDNVVRMLDFASGKEIRRFRGLPGPVFAIDSSASGKWVAAGTVGPEEAEDKKPAVWIWEMATGKAVRRFDSPSPNTLWGAQLWFTFARRSDSLLIWGNAGDLAGMTRIWDESTRANVWLPQRAQDEFAVSLDEKWLIAEDGSVVDLASGEIVRKFRADRGPSSSSGLAAGVGPADSLAIGWLSDGTLAVVWSNNAVDIFARPTDDKPRRSVRLPDLPADWESSRAYFAGQVTILELETQDSAEEAKSRVGIAGRAEVFALGENEPRSFQSNVNPILSLAASREGKLILGSSDKCFLAWGDAPTTIASQDQWKLATGEQAFSLDASSDGRMLLIARTRESTAAEPGSPIRMTSTLELWRRGAETPMLSLPLSEHGFFDFLTFAQGSFAAFSPDERSVLFNLGANEAPIHDAASGKLLTTLRGHAKPITTVAYSADGTRALTAALDRTARIWEASTGRLLKTFRTDDWVTAMTLSADGKSLLAGGASDLEQRLNSDDLSFESIHCNLSQWDLASGRQVKKVRVGHAPPIAFSCDGRHFCTAYPGISRSATLWDLASGKPIAALPSHQGAIGRVGFSPDSRFVLTGSTGGPARVWDAQTGRLLCDLVMFEDGNWAVVDSRGRFDSSQGGNLAYLHWVINNEPIKLSQLKERYYEPGLLSKILGTNADPLRPVETFSNPELFPHVELSAPTHDKPTLGITVKDRGGGIGRVVVKIGGKEQTGDARPRGADPRAARLDLEVDLASEPLLKPGQPNRIEVYVFNAAGYLSSRGLELSYTPPSRPMAAPRLWAVVVGVSEYRGDSLKLRYAAKDAEDFAGALKIAAGRLFQPDNVQIQLLTSENATPPTRENIQKAFDAVRSAQPAPQPDDILVIYLAGHGVNWGGAEGDFHYLTSDALSVDLSDPVARQQSAVSSAELADFIKRIPALKQVMILDTCASGRLVEKLTEKRDVPSSQRRALDRLQDRTGLFILAGCAADRVSFEATRYAQGLLTYSLLKGIRGAALREQQFVDVQQLFGFAADEVPNLAKDIGGIQRPIVTFPQGGNSFDIGQLTSADKSLIPLQMIRPMVLRASFQDEKRLRDHLGLTRHVNECLREASARGRGAAMVFVDSEEYPDAYVLVGRYRVDDEQVVASVVIAQGEREIQFDARGSADATQEFARQIVDKAERHLRSLATESPR